VIGKLVLAVVVLVWTTKALGQPLAVFVPDDEQRLSIVTVPDGQWEPFTMNGTEAARLIPPSLYLYFKVAPEVRERVGTKLYLVVEFLDSGMGGAVFEYNSVKGAYTRGPGLLMTDSGEWAKGLVHVTNAQLRGLQNGGADFRFYYPAPLAIARIEIYTERPDMIIPSDRERMARAVQSQTVNPPPKDMFYTFGNDATEANALLYRTLGVTSVESYVTWETCERAGEGQWDWSRWDEQVRILQDNDLKWVPFIILGPAYSTPDWFRASDDHFPCRCLEHGIDSKIESLWNPHLPKWIDRFLGAFATRYRDSGVIESVLLGIQGDFGEAIYSVVGDWTQNIPGPYHNHPGFWCDDAYALADFREFVHERYGRVKKLNNAWGVEFASWSDINFPGRKDELAAFRARIVEGNPHARRRWLDFVDWYRGSMTDFADWWIETTRRHFPDTPIYLCTGGHAPPEHGANFAEQCRVAAKHNAGVRITNEASNYPANFNITRWVAAAGRHYGAYFGFEPAGSEDELGIVARIYNATCSGANQLHDYSPNVVSSTARMEAQRSHLKYLFHVPEPRVPMALWYPNVAQTLDWGPFLEKAAAFRDYADYDYVDETLLAAGALQRYKILLILHGNVIETDDARRIAEWMENGGHIIVMDVPRFESVEGTDAPEQVLFKMETVPSERSEPGLKTGTVPSEQSEPGLKTGTVPSEQSEPGLSPFSSTIDPAQPGLSPTSPFPRGKGSIVRVSGWEALAAQLCTRLEVLDLPVCDLEPDHVFYTQIGDERFLLLNTNDREAPFAIHHGDKHADGAVGPRTISEIRLAP